MNGIIYDLKLVLVLRFDWIRKIHGRRRKKKIDSKSEKMLKEINWQAANQLPAEKKSIVHIRSFFSTDTDSGRFFADRYRLKFLKCGDEGFIVW